MVAHLACGQALVLLQIYHPLVVDQAGGDLSVAKPADLLEVEHKLTQNQIFKVFLCGINRDKKVHTLTVVEGVLDLTKTQTGRNILLVDMRHIQKQ
jgi:ornithine cyclodeaminase/alanine dehydrogenase-like protein (mu-crystallin family)